MVLGNKFIISVCFLLFTIAGGTLCFALEADEGFGEIPWGSSEVFITENAKGTLQTQKKINSAQWNNSPIAAFSEMTLAPEVVLLQYTGKYAEVTEYYLSQGKLCMVLHRPPYTKSFDPLGYVMSLDLLYKDIMTRNKYKNIRFPISWGRYDMRTEYPLTIEWKNENSFVRLACKSWPGEEMREIKAVIYTSVKQKAANIARLEAIQAEIAAEKARKEEEAKAKLTAQTNAAENVDAEKIELRPF